MQIKHTMSVILIAIILLVAGKNAQVGASAYSEQEVWIDNQGQKIFGVLYMPKTDKKSLPLVLFSHELSATHATGDGYAKALAAQGVAVYAFDYRGGGSQSKSDGKTTDMSIMTEESDLATVLKTAREWSFVDKNKVVIIGASQGGLVASMVADKYPQDIKGLVLLYPAFVIKDELHKHYMSLDEVPQELTYNGWIKVGKRYVADAWNFDPYADMMNFTKPVLILHGDEDKDVPPYYSKEAQRRYPNAQLHMIYGTGHMFPETKSHNEAQEQMILYMRKIGIL